jgi:hypothetical protein
MARANREKASRGCATMEPARPIIADVSTRRVSARRAHRRVRVNLYELEPESGEDERLSLHLDLDQIEE